MPDQPVEPTGRIIDELRAAAATWPAPHTDVAVRGLDLYPSDFPADGSAPRAIVVRREPSRRVGRTALRIQEVVLLCYDPDPRLAAVLAVLAEHALHAVGPRVAGTAGARVAIYRSTATSSSGTIVEPDTRYPHERVRVEVMAAAITVA